MKAYAAWSICVSETRLESHRDNTVKTHDNRAHMDFIQVPTVIQTDDLNELELKIIEGVKNTFSCFRKDRRLEEVPTA